MKSGIRISVCVCFHVTFFGNWSCSSPLEENLKSPKRFVKVSHLLVIEYIVFKILQQIIVSLQSKIISSALQFWSQSLCRLLCFLVHCHSTFYLHMVVYVIEVIRYVLYTKAQTQLLPQHFQVKKFKIIKEKANNCTCINTRNC